MLFVVSYLSDARLAPKLVEQLELPLKMPPELRLLRLIAKVPGLQKLGQVIARNRFLRPSLRRALSQLENGIRDVKPADIHSIIERELGERLKTFAVRISPSILSEASVSAVVRFTWRNPASGRRQRGVFKVLKPHIPKCFAEDMNMLQGLTEFFGSRHRQYGIARDVLTDTFTKVRRLLQHEIHFLGEQKTLVEAFDLYRSMRGIRVPQVFPPLCTSIITAMSEERGVKVTSAVEGMSGRRCQQLAGRLIEALIAAPLLSARESALFHADPHAGNLFYDERTGGLIILDWALTERLSREQRRHMALLVFAVGLRDCVGACNEIQALSHGAAGRDSREARIIRDTVTEFLDDLPLKHIPRAVDAMRLLQWTAARGIRFAASLIMLSKVLFTLEGVIADIRGSGVSMAYTLACHGLKSWVESGARARLPLTVQDVARLQCSALLYGGRLSIRLEQAMLDRLLPPISAVAG
jgi:predicted unusual protein kinase regulating ubiquinone biosynthesis (AarF/ABC1/UbiB family)